MQTMKPGAKITGSDRARIAADIKKQYEKGTSIRELAEKHGRSYGFVHRILAESGATLRPRGGAAARKTTKTKAK